MLKLIIAVSNFELMLCVCITTRNSAFCLCRCVPFGLTVMCLYTLTAVRCATVRFNCVLIVTNGALCIFFCCACHGIRMFARDPFSLRTVNGIETMCLCSARRGKDAGSTWCSWRLWRPVRRRRWVQPCFCSFVLTRYTVLLCFLSQSAAVCNGGTL